MYREFCALNESRGASPKKPAAWVMPGTLKRSAIGSRASVGSARISAFSMEPPVAAFSVLRSGRSGEARMVVATSV